MKVNQWNILQRTSESQPMKRSPKNQWKSTNETFSKEMTVVLRMEYFLFTFDGISNRERKKIYLVNSTYKSNMHLGLAP